MMATRHADRRARLARVALAALAAACLWAALPPDSARAQQDTVIVGGPGGGRVIVDLSVLEEAGRPTEPERRPLLFPGTSRQPGERVVLNPPGTRLAAPRLRPPRAKSTPARRPPAARPEGSDPAAVSSRRAAPAPTARPKSRPAPPPSASVPRPTMPPPPPPPPDAMASGTPSATPPPSPSPSRAVPAPPPLPPVSAAPRTGVDRKPTPGDVPSVGSESRTAALPPPPPSPGGLAAGSTRSIMFEPASAALPAAAGSTLKAAALALTRDPVLRLELKAYAAAGKDGESRARRLSLSRALAVRSFLIKEGVKPTRIDVRALGSGTPGGPADRVDLSVVSR